MSSTTNLPYTIATTNEQDNEEITHFFRAAFFKKEPLTKYYFSDNNCTLKSHKPAKYKNEVSVKAVSNGKIIGICLCNPLRRRNEHSKAQQNQNEKGRPIKNILSYVEKQADVFGHFQSCDSGVDIMYLAVDDAFTRRGIAKELVNRVRYMAEENKYGFLVSTCTSHFSKRALEQLGFDCIFRMDYSSYKVDGEIVFKPPEPHTAITVYAKSLTDVDERHQPS